MFWDIKPVISCHTRTYKVCYLCYHWSTMSVTILWLLTSMRLAQAHPNKSIRNSTCVKTTMVYGDLSARPLELYDWSVTPVHILYTTPLLSTQLLHNDYIHSIIVSHSLARWILFTRTFIADLRSVVWSSLTYSEYYNSIIYYSTNVWLTDFTLFSITKSTSTAWAEQQIHDWKQNNREKVYCIPCTNNK